MPRRAAFPAALIAAMTLVTGPAPAAVRIGSNLISTPVSSPVCSGMECTVANLALPRSNQALEGFVSTVNGTVSNWSYRSGAPSAQPIRLRVLHPTEGLSFTGAGTTVSTPVFGGIQGLFPADLPIGIGDLIGLDANGAQVMTDGVAGAAQVAWAEPPLADGNVRSGTATAGVETLVQATIQPTNTVGFGAVRRRRGKGTATVAVTVPNAGSLRYGGPGVRTTGPESIAGPGEITIRVAAKGSKLRTLKRRGAVHVQPEIVFTPGFGEPGTTVHKLKLIRKRRATV